MRMSESTENQNVESRQEKLAPLRSLRDAGEEADIWKTITKRYPNAAPLLREMEVVIDRAENILRQVRSNSYNADGNSQGMKGLRVESWELRIQTHRDASSSGVYIHIYIYIYIYFFF